MIQFTIVTPCYNAEQHIEETIHSVFAQRALHTGRAKLEYIIVDGKSSDGTVTLIEKCATDFTHGTTHILSEPDRGMYEALAKGLKLATGQVCAYLNAGDLYSPHAFDIVIDVLETHMVQWLTGLRTVHNEKGQMVSCQLPFPYRSRLFQGGLYDNITLPHLQQESTFWHSELHEFIDFNRLAEFKYAGDYYLWSCFAQHTELKIVEAHLGGFRVHAGQLSENFDAYTAELHAIGRQPDLLDRMIALSDKALSHMPRRLWQRLYSEAVLSFDHTTQRWR